MELDAFSLLFYPKGDAQLTRFYLVWMLIYWVGHFVWDWKSSKTPAFSVERLKERGVPTVYNAATFASSLLLLLALWNDSVIELLDDTSIPLAIAGFSGLIQGVITLVPPKG